MSEERTELGVTEVREHNGMIEVDCWHPGYDQKLTAKFPYCQLPKPDALGMVLQLSNFHIPQPIPDFGSLRSAETEYGWVFWTLDPDSIATDSIEPWLAAINRYANEHKCVMVEFDMDNEKCDLFESFDW
jgi:hypothetical protein